MAERKVPRMRKRKRPDASAHPTRVSEEQRELFLVELRKVQNVAEAARRAGIGRRTVYRWRQDNEEFAERWDEAWEESVDRLEQVTMERATDGWEEPVFYQGKKCGTVTRFSPELMKFMLSKNRRKKYGDGIGMDDGEGPDDIEKNEAFL